MLPYSRQQITSEDIDSVARVMQSDFVTQGQEVEHFESNLAAYTGARYAVCVSSGTAALHLCVKALGANEDTVGITSPITFAASSNCFLYCNCPVEFVDVHPSTGLMSNETLHEKLSEIKKKGIIIPVSLQGRAADLVGIKKIADEFGWKVVEDAAHSLGATYDDGKTIYKSASCEHSDAAILSFHPLKHVCAGEGGAILTNDEELAEEVRLLRSHGINKKAGKTAPTWFYDQVSLGYNYRMSELHAALGNSQLKRIDDFIEHRRLLAQRYRTFLNEKPFSDLFRIDPHVNGHVYHLFVINFYEESIRDAAHKFLLSKSIYSQVHYRPVFELSYYKSMNKYKEDEYTGAQKYSSGCLAIPLFHGMTNEQQDYVIEMLQFFCNSVSRASR